jgi:hypothetical protein
MTKYSPEVYIRQRCVRDSIPIYSGFTSLWRFTVAVPVADHVRVARSLNPNQPTLGLWSEATA